MSLMNIANELMILPVEKKGNFCPISGGRLNHFAVSPTDPHLVWAPKTKDHRRGVYQVPPRKSSDDHKWRNSIDHAVFQYPDHAVLKHPDHAVPKHPDHAALKHASSDVSAVVDDESSEQRRRDGGPRSGMNRRDRRRDARKHLQPSYNAEPPPKSYNAEPHNYD